MTTDVSRIQGTYKIQNSNGSDILVVDTTGTSYPVPSATNSKVVITGDLIVVGTQTQSSSTNVTITDPTILLNQGDTFYPKPGGGYLAGIQISRSDNDSPDTSAFIQWNESAVWHGTGILSAVTGTFEFRVGLPTSPNPHYGAIKVNKILIDEATASTINGNPRLNILGSDNPDTVISVSGNVGYTNNIDDDFDIPNVAWVNRQIIQSASNAVGVVDGNSYITIIDHSIDNKPSAIIGVLDGHPTDKSLPLSTGTLVLNVSAASAQIGSIEITQGRIQPVGNNYNLTLASTGTGQIVLASPLLFQTTNVPVPGLGQTGLYGKDPSGGGTGVYFVNKTSGGATTADEFVSRKKALIFSFIF
jgi:hypothetical protein